VQYREIRFAEGVGLQIELMISTIIISRMLNGILILNPPDLASRAVLLFTY